MSEFNIEEREQICRNCPIFLPSENRCNPRLWINPDTDEVSTTHKPGYIRGCGCYVIVKMRNKNSHCVAHKW